MNFTEMFKKATLDEREPEGTKSNHPKNKEEEK